MNALNLHEIIGAVFLGSWGLLCVVFYAASIWLKDEKRRSDVRSLGSNVCFFFLIACVSSSVYFFGTGNPTFPVNGAIVLTPEESIELASKKVEEQQQYSRAIDILRSSSSALAIGDSRAKPIIRMITETEQKMSK